MKKLLFILFLLGFPMSIYASHLMGGSLGYEYLGLQPSGKYRYKIKLTTYVDCSPSSEIPYAEYPLRIGVYSNDLMNPNANKPLIDSLELTVDDTIVYTPYLPPGCVVGSNTCIIQARYSGYIDLDPNVNGYYLFYERCCRNTSILNLQPDASNSFLAFIPPTNVVNNTPDFLYPPIPFLCVNDTNTIINTAIDIDGDSLVYEFATPLSGFGGVWDPQPNLPAPIITWPVIPVDYVIGFDKDEPFGYFGTALINANNGISTYISALQGTFVVCIKVDEYRGGILISTTYRDLQLLFNNCPINSAPRLVDNLEHNYEATRGEELCFNLTFRDPENDSVFIKADGNIFDPSVTDTPAVFEIIDMQMDQATGRFCWSIPCSIDTGLYQFNVRAYDNGCPPKETNELYTIHVIEPAPPYLFGPDSACMGSDSALYYMLPDGGYQYQWDITGGNIMLNKGDSIMVTWGYGLNAQVLVNAYTSLGCFIRSDSMDVTLVQNPIPGYAYVVTDTSCDGIHFEFINTSQLANHYYWDFNNGETSTEINPTTIFDFGNDYIVWLTAYNQFGCSAEHLDTIHTNALGNFLSPTPVNVFTPNDDGLNDFLDFSLPAEFLECTQVYIYDRWGLSIFQSDGTNFSWDGKVEGKLVPEGVYFWIVEINGVKKQGFVHIFE